MPDMYVYDLALRRLAVLDNYRSVQLERRYNGVGQLKVEAPLTDTTRDSLGIDRIVYIDGRAAIIDDVQYLDDKDGGRIVCRGCDLVGILGRRINADIVSYTNIGAEALMYRLVLDNCVAPKDVRRRMPGIVNCGSIGLTERITKQDSYSNLVDLLTDIARTATADGIISPLGYTVRPDFAAGTLVFEVYRGADRRGQVVFDAAYDNVLSYDYCCSDNGCNNVAYAFGTGEGADRIGTVWPDTHSGYDRRELYVDARDLTQDEGVTADAYRALLQQRAAEKLAAIPRVETFAAEIAPSSNYRLGVDYNLGDVVTVSSRAWGLRMHTRVTAVQEIYETSGYSLNVTFGDDVPTLIERVKRMER